MISGDSSSPVWRRGKDAFFGAYKCGALRTKHFRVSGADVSQRDDGSFVLDQHHCIETIEDVDMTPQETEPEAEAHACTG